MVLNNGKHVTNSLARRAILSSLRHWERNKKIRIDQTSWIWSEGFLGKSCALCKLFYNPALWSCYQCPLELLGQKCDSEGSPWRAAIDGNKLKMIKALKGALKVLDEGKITYNVR